jgi:hypothetical protein
MKWKLSPDRAVERKSRDPNFVLIHWRNCWLEEQRMGQGIGMRYETESEIRSATQLNMNIMI